MKASTKIINKVAIGECPNANCNNADIEKTRTEDGYNGSVTIYYACSNCGSEWYFKYEPYAINIFEKPENFKLIEEE